MLKFPINFHCNTQAFKHLLDLHVLFASPDPQSDIVLPTASVSLTLDDEVQYRCVGYIQAEIERYAESLGSGAAEEPEGEKDSDAEESSEGEQADEAAKAKRAKGKKTLKEGSLGFLIHLCRVEKESDGSCCISVDTSSRTLLEEEYLFMDVMSTFLRAIRAGAIHIRHGATLIAHYGRLGPAFDVCSKVIVDVLRDEGMANNNGEIVVSVLTRALEEVRGCFIYCDILRLKFLRIGVYACARWHSSRRNERFAPGETPCDVLRNQRKSTLGSSAPRESICRSNPYRSVIVDREAPGDAPAQ